MLKKLTWKRFNNALRGFALKIRGWGERRQRSDFSNHFNPQEITLVLKEQLLVGCFLVEDRVNQLFIRMIAIHPQHQRSGIGKEL